MVAVSFIVEGGCERIALRSSAFRSFLAANGIQLIGDVIDINGKGNLKQSSQRMQSQVKTLRDAGTDWIVILRDLDEPMAVEALIKEKAKLFQADDVLACFAVQEIEAWFLADSNTLSRLFEADYHCEFPESIIKPADHLSDLNMQFKNRGVRDKKGFTSTLVNNGFSIERAAAHPNCPSARYFLTKLKTLASAN